MDTYNLKARVYPLILTFLPILLMGIIFSISLESYYQTLSSLGIITFLYFIFSQIGRDRGKQLEKEMWEKWDGAPTIQLLRYTNEILDRKTKKRYQEYLRRETGIGDEITIEFEKKHKIETDEIYKSWIKYLIAKTRDKKKYNLLFQENINYGFRRNLYGLKFFSISLLLLLMISIIGYSYCLLGVHEIFSQEVVISEIILIFFLAFWIRIVNEEWIRIVAFAYAERLLETIDMLEE